MRRKRIGWRLRLWGKRAARPAGLAILAVFVVASCAVVVFWDGLPWQGPSGPAPAPHTSETAAARRAADRRLTTAPPSTGYVGGDNGLAAGDCFDQTTSRAIVQVQRRTCDALHHFEVYGVADYPGGPEAPYPTREESSRVAADACDPLFEPYVGSSLAHSDLVPLFSFPYERDWPYDHRIVCFFTTRTGAAMSGSLRGTGR